MQRPDESANEPGEGGVTVLHRVPFFSDKWLIGEEPVPEAEWHQGALELLKAVLDYWVARTRRDARVFRNLAIRVRREQWRVGFDPDLCLVTPAPPSPGELSSLRLWEADHVVPSLVVEVVSPGHPYKDYSDIPDRCAAVGVRELVVFDPVLVGPKALGGPQRLSVWRRTDADHFERVACGEGPFHSEVLGAFLIATEDGRRLRVADDPEGSRLWPTEAEAALARVAELEAELRRRG